MGERSIRERFLDEAARFVRAAGRIHGAPCRPGIRQSCDALHCGRRPHLHDDLATITLEAATIRNARVHAWPAVKHFGPIPADVARFLETLHDVA